MKSQTMTKKICKTTLTNISDLPDELRLKILSFLSTKRAVVTSVLSKQWKSLWTKVPTLKFDKSEHNDYISFERFVDKSLFKHQSHVLESFHLKVANTFLDENIGPWIRTALHRHHCQLHGRTHVIRSEITGSMSFYAILQVFHFSPGSATGQLRELEIDAEHVRLLLPPELFTIKTLVVLKLKGKEINVEAPLTTACLPSLKTLHHHSRRFDFESLQMLLSSCNFLTDLIVTRETTRLMVIQESRFFEFDMSWCKALVALKLEGLKDVISSSSFEVCLPFLKTLHVAHMMNFDSDSFHRLLSNCPLLSDLTLEEKTIDVLLNLDVDMPCLQRLSIITKVEGLIHLCSLLNYIRKLAIITPPFKYFSIQEMWYTRDYPCIVRGRVGDPSKSEDASIFRQIVHLELDIRDKRSVEKLIHWLLCSSKLVVLKLKNVYTAGAGMDRWDPLSFVPQCLLSSLEALEWRGYTGRAGDKDLVSYLLNHALCLKTVKIFYKSYPRDVQWNQKIEEDLASMPRGSKSCVLVCEVIEL